MDAASFRRALFAACKQLGLDEDARHDMLQAVTGKRSSGDLNPLERARVLAHLNRLTGRGGHEGKPADPAAYKQALMDKIEALLADMALPWAYLTSSKRCPSMCRRLAGVDRLEFAEPDGLKRIVAALTYRQRRAKDKAA